MSVPGEKLPNILDVCSGSRMMWFKKNDNRAVFTDIRKESHTLCDGRALNINPDIQMDFRNLSFEDATFNLVVFDPPHLIYAGNQSWLALKYGALGSDWRDDIRLGFDECLRVLKPGGVLIFKWSEIQIKTSEVLALVTLKPLFGHPSGKRSNTHWIVFMKDSVNG